MFMLIIQNDKFMKSSYIKRLLLMLFACYTQSSVLAQLEGEPNAYVQKARIGLVDEFIKRFNGVETHPNIQNTDANSRKKKVLPLNA